MRWQDTYPDLATMMLAGFETLAQWRERLPAPQTDVERTVRRRLEVRYQELGRKELRRQEPAIADRINAAIDKMKALGIACPMERFD
jgi:ABC-type amino acid transport substrate-binding protein